MRRAGPSFLFLFFYCGDRDPLFSPHIGLSLFCRPVLSTSKCGEPLFKKKCLLFFLSPWSRGSPSCTLSFRCVVEYTPLPRPEMSRLFRPFLFSASCSDTSPLFLPLKCRMWLFFPFPSSAQFSFPFHIVRPPPPLPRLPIPIHPLHMEDKVVLPPPSPFRIDNKSSPLPLTFT